jgi:predicted TIM-barrel fold metal-dependent hydrolase
VSAAFIVDAHAHTGAVSLFFSPESGAAELLARMDALDIQCCLNAGDWTYLMQGGREGLELLRREHEASAGRLLYLGVFDPRRGRESLRELEEACRRPGLAGIKIHPTFHRTPAESPGYEPLWRFAEEHELTVLAHSWSSSEHNPAQALSLPGRFESWVRRHPGVRLVLAHAGGRGDGRAEAVRLAREHPQVYLDLAGDIFCHRLIETLSAAVPPNKLLFGSDFPWLDPRANLSRVLLAEVPLEAKRRILRDNAQEAYQLNLPG